MAASFFSVKFPLISIATDFAKKIPQLAPGENNQGASTIHLFSIDAAESGKVAATIKVSSKVPISGSSAGLSRPLQRRLWGLA